MNGEGRPAVVVRLATADELDDAGAAVFAAYQAEGFVPPHYRAPLLAARDRARDAEVAVAVDDAGRVIGSVTFVLPGSRWSELAAPDEAEFRMLGVRPEHRGRAVGMALVEWCLDRAASSGRRRVLLGTVPSMRSAQRLYERCGFVRCPERDFSPAPGVHLLVFSLDLAGRTAATPGVRGTAPARPPLG